MFNRKNKKNAIDVLEQEKKEAERKIFTEAEIKRVDKESLELSRTEQEIQLYETGGFLKVYSSRFEQNTYVRISDIVAVTNRGYFDLKCADYENFKSIVFTKGSYEFYFLSELNITELMYLMTQVEEGERK